MTSVTVQTDPFDHFLINVGCEVVRAFILSLPHVKQDATRGEMVYRDPQGVAVYIELLFIDEHGQDPVDKVNCIQCYTSHSGVHKESSLEKSVSIAQAIVEHLNTLPGDAVWFALIRHEDDPGW